MGLGDISTEKNVIGLLRGSEQYRMKKIMSSTCRRNGQWLQVQEKCAGH